MSEIKELDSIETGTPLVFRGNQFVRVPEAIARRFQAGDSLAVVEETGEILLIPRAERMVATDAVGRAVEAFSALSAAPDVRITKFYDTFADRLEDDTVWDAVRRVNDRDVSEAAERGRSTTRLVASDKMRRMMIDGLRGWASASSRRGQVLESVDHDGWKVELVGAALGSVGFVFEGRPNVVADATGVLRGGNTVVFRIGRDALNTARALMNHALVVALRAAELPEHSVSLVNSPEHAAGWALFSDPRLALAVARGSGPAVATLGALARQSGIPASLHGTGGAWLVASVNARLEPFRDAVTRSLDRKVCNTLNTCCIPQGRAPDLVPALLEGLATAGKRLGQAFKLHVLETSRQYVPPELFESRVTVRRATGDCSERQAEPIAEDQLGREFEWEQTPEISLAVVRDVDHAVELFNRYSPRFVACLIGDDAGERARFYESVHAPFVGDGFTRWVDGQFALRRPELGLSNWQAGRLFGRGGILTGDTVFTVRTRAIGTSR